MRHKKGFTLIELIAVLIIMAVVALIVAPLILNTIRRVKNSVNMRSIDGYGRAVEYAMANYQLKHLTYPDTFDELEIEYSGNKVECDTSRINPDHTIYLSECKVNGKLVKDNKNKDGYYHYGILKMTNIEYVDTYGKNLEDALKKYYDEHNEYPSDYTTLELPKLDKEVNCDVDVNPDGTVYLNNCKVDNEDVVDGNEEVYVYGNLYASTSLLKKTNSKSITTYTNGNPHEMYTFDHEATEQTPALTDYRYIGNEPYNYVTFNGNETWRIIGVFDVEDGEGNWDRRIKLIRDDSLGNYSWDSSDSNLNSGYGFNEWEQSHLMAELNGDYINNSLSSNTYWYNGANNQKTGQFDYTKVLNNNSKEMISNAKYYLGGRQNNSVDGNVFYINERGTTVYSGRNINWIGLVGLMYPSDYIYTYGLGVDNTCYSTSGSCNNGIPSSGWIYRSNNTQWTIMSYSSNSTFIFYFHSIGYNDSGRPRSPYGVRPVVYLKPNVKIKSGDGSIGSPYEFEL